MIVAVQMYGYQMSYRSIIYQWNEETNPTPRPLKSRGLQPSLTGNANTKTPKHQTSGVCERRRIYVTLLQQLAIPFSDAGRFE